MFGHDKDFQLGPKLSPQQLCYPSNKVGSSTFILKYSKNISIVESKKSTVHNSLL